MPYLAEKILDILYNIVSIQIENNGEEISIDDFNKLMTGVFSTEWNDA